MRVYFIVTNPIKKMKSWIAWKRAPNNPLVINDFTTQMILEPL